MRPEAIYDAPQKKTENKAGMDTKVDRKKIMKEHEQKRKEFVASLEDDTKVKFAKIDTVDNDDTDAALETLQATLSADLKALKKLQGEAKKQSKGNRE